MPRGYRPIQSDHAEAWQMDRFAEFADLKSEVGEPTPHMRIIEWLGRDSPEDERIWLAGAYAAGYSVLTAEAIVREWPWARYLAEPEGLAPWLMENWSGIHTRTPRRCVRTVGAFHRCLVGYASWVMETLPRLRESLYSSPVLEYDAYWASAERMPFMGRYIVIRLLELYRRWGLMSPEAELYDIRAMGAESPVRCLALLRQRESDALLTGDPAVADRVAREVIGEARERSVDPASIGWFRFAALLCEYRKSYEDRGDYPGNQTDEELGYSFGRHALHWAGRGFDTRLFEARASLFDPAALGERHGWSGQRSFAAGALRRFGRNWSDRRYSWHDSVAADALVAWPEEGNA